VNTSDSGPISGGDGFEAPVSRRKPLGFVVMGLVGVVILSAVLLRDGRRDYAAAVARMNEGVALLEQYDYGTAYRVFEELTGHFPHWEAAWVNRGLAALNLQDEERCVSALDRALEINPRSCHALTSLGIQQHHLSHLDEALALFHRVLEVDPEDPHAHYQIGRIHADREDREAANRHLRRAVQLQPSLGSAWYQLAQLHRTKAERDKRLEMLGEFKRLRDSGASILVDVKYGDGGKYNLAMRGTAPPGAPPGIPSAVFRDGATGFLPDGLTIDSSRDGIAITSPDGEPLPPGFALGDLDGDGGLEVAHCGVGPGDDGSRACEIVSLESSQQIAVLPFDPLLVAFADLDGDSDLDVVGAADGWLRVFVNDGEGGFTEAPLGDVGRTSGFPVRLHTVDVDSDWDVDIVCLRQISGDGGGVRSVVEILNNNRDSVEEGAVGSFTDIAPTSGVGPFDFAASELVVADLDRDIDLDLLVFDGETGTPHLFSNHRAWRLVPVDPAAGVPTAPGVRATTGIDIENDGLEDLVLFCGDRLRLWRNRGGMRFEEDAEFARLHGAVGGSAGVAWTLTPSLEPGLVVLDPRGGSGPGDGGVPILIPALDESQTLSPRVNTALCTPDAVSGALTSTGLTGELRLVVQGTRTGLLALPLEPHGGWIGVDLRGPTLSERRPAPGERSNPTAIGASVEVRVGTRAVRHQLTTASGGTARNATRFVCGIGGADSVDQVRILWPDGILQSEIGLTTGKVHTIREKERKPSSCPVLFAWNGEAFEFVGDFLGVGGLGYFEAPGRYSTPDPSEIIAISRLESRHCEALGESAWEMRILEPLEECTYLDSASLLVVDHPVGTTVLPLEMFAISGPAPGYGLLAFEKSCDPLKVIDQDGRDVTRSILALDGNHAPELDVDPRFRGVLLREQAIEVEFPDAVDEIIAGTDGGHRPVLFLWGYIEYGFSTTNFAASQAGFVPKAPSFRVERGGEWVTLRGEWGFPGGYPRWMAVDLGGLLEKGDRRLRIDSNLEIAWDRVFVASARDVTIDADAAGNQRELAGVRVHELLADRAELRYRGFPVDPPPGDEVEGFRYGEFHREEHYRAMAGSYTRFGDVRELLASDDDRFAILGPGDEVVLAVKASRLSGVARGQKRSFFLKSGGYCKDTDLYTGRGDAGEPLPFRGMPAYPYDDVEYPVSGVLGDYRQRWNTRVVEGSSMKMIGDVIERR